MRKRILIAAISIIVVIATLLIYNLKTILKARLNSLIIQGQESEYTYYVGDVDINLLGRSLTLSDIELKPKLDQLRKANRKTYIYLKVGELSFSNFDFIKLLTLNQIEIESINISHPVIRIYNTKKRDHKEGLESNQNKKVLSDILSTNISSLSIGKLSLDHAQTKIYKLDPDTSLSINASNTELKIFGIYTDKELFSSHEILTFDSSEVALQGVQYYGLKDYDIKLGSFKSNSASDHIVFEDLAMVPLEDKITFTSRQDIERDWYNISISEMVLEQFDRQAFQSSGHINAEKLLIEGASIEIYRDKRKRDKKPKQQMLPSALIRSIDPPIDIEEVSIKSSSLKYLEHEIDAAKPIEVQFKELEMEIKNLCSDSSKLLENDVLELKANGVFMKGGSVTVASEFYLLDPDDRFQLKASLKGMPMPDLNPILEESAFISFEDGRLNDLSFMMKADKYRAKGHLDISYSSLSNMKILRKQSEIRERKAKGKRGRKSKGLLSFLVSSLVPSEYGPQSENYHQGKIDIRRDQHKSIVNYLIMGIKDGLLSNLLHEHQGLQVELKKRKH